MRFMDYRPQVYSRRSTIHTSKADQNKEQTTKEGVFPSLSSGLTVMSSNVVERI